MSENKFPILVDRSRYETYTCDCQMKRFLTYHSHGTGIVPISKSYHLEVGIAVHEGVARVMHKLMDGYSPKEEYLENAIQYALVRFEKRFKNKNKGFKRRGLSTEADGTRTYYLTEAKALIEGLIRVWYQTEADVIWKNYRVIAVELDQCYWLDRGDGIKLMWKADAIMVKKSTGEGVVYNIKTMRQYDVKESKKRARSIQNFTETWGAKRWLELRNKVAAKQIKELKEVLASKKSEFEKKEVWREIEEARGMIVDMPRIWNVRLVGLIKGRSVYNKNMERYELDGPLLRYWKKKADTKAKGPKRTAMWEYSDGHGNVRKLYGPGYDKMQSWRVKGGIKRYLEMFAEEKIYPGLDIWKWLVVVDGEQMITDAQIDTAMMQVKMGEREVLAKLNRLHLFEKNHGEVSWDMLQSVFRPNYLNCYAMDICAYEEYCTNHGVRQSPFDNSVKKFEKRDPHHDAERRE